MTPGKPCAACGRILTWRKRWERDWDQVRYCSAACRRRGADHPQDLALERAVVELLSGRDRQASICPSEAARQVGGERWRELMEPARSAARRLVARGEVEITGWSGRRSLDGSRPAAHPPAPVGMTTCQACVGLGMKVEIWSDVVCPWCYIGKRRFERALSEFAHRDEVEIVWRPFELDPAAPAVRTGDYAERLADKYGTDVASARGMIANMTQAAAQDGLDFRFDLARVGNTFDAHRLLHWAHEQGRQDALKERLLRATFTEGEPIGDRGVLARLAGEVGLDSALAREVLSSDRYATAVREQQAQAQAYGIHGVPFFVIDGRYGVSGAQSAETLHQVLEKAWRDSRPLEVVTAGAAPGCESDACAV